MHNGKLKLKLLRPEKNKGSMTRRRARMPTLVVTTYWSINGLELPCLAATLCLYETRVTRVVCSCTVYEKVTSPKNINWQPPLQSKIQPWHSWQLVIGQNISLWYVADHWHNQFYKVKMHFIKRVSAHESVAKVKYFQCKLWLLTALCHKYSYIGLQTQCIMGYVKMFCCTLWCERNFNFFDKT